ncbi:MAG: glycosyltransferase family 2 protein [Tychonema bourrellyi B0820]|uniref:Glycosyltransferase family 2 protein n=1 Tax=Tychonema bourrellyi FEM_GT703 TaxID=2040638 RepID=A0A2G4EVC2_9CYAN|nr:glycosyltransferase family 2 protein [Tychonema bourrellyi]MDQ2099843.1 glycosyltransferase family 2 protein [Tychonema bourrellyi B0820]PHX53479.1 glycosyltransferase family 2 protein [Tychonema bourrellyi FEM_GT703]
MPKISVCIPTCNRVHLLAGAIASVLAQSYTDFELIVCDDGSTDSTPLLMSEFVGDGIRYIRHSQNIGKSNNMRSGFAAARGKYFIKFDDDDRLTPQFLERTSAILDKNDSIDFVSTDHWVIDINNQIDESLTKLNSHRWGRTELSAGIIQDLLTTVFVQQSLQIGATLFRRSVLEEVGFLRPNWQNCEDNDLFVRLAIAGKKCYYLPELLMEYRFHVQQQGCDRAIPYLTDKLRYLTGYEFDAEKLESVRLRRIAETQLALGLRLIEVGETQKGRWMVRAGKSVSEAKMWAGLGLSLLPMKLRGRAFAVVRDLVNSAEF